MAQKFGRPNIAGWNIDCRKVAVPVINVDESGEELTPAEIGGEATRSPYRVYQRATTTQEEDDRRQG